MAGTRSEESWRTEVPEFGRTLLHSDTVLVLEMHSFCYDFALKTHFEEVTVQPGGVTRPGKIRRQARGYVNHDFGRCLQADRVLCRLGERSCRVSEARTCSRRLTEVALCNMQACLRRRFCRKTFNVCPLTTSQSTNPELSNQSLNYRIDRTELA